MRTICDGLFLVVCLAGLLGCWQRESLGAAPDNPGEHEIEGDLKAKLAAKSHPDGVEKLYWGDGHLKKQQAWKNGQPNGKWTEYYENGVVREASRYNNGKLEGMQISYYSSGEVKSSVEYKSGKEVEGSRNGLFRSTIVGGAYPGSTYALTPYKGGVIDGVEHWFYIDGVPGYDDPSLAKLAERKQYVNGLLHGTSERYDEQGHLISTTEYCNNLAHGSHKEYSVNGSTIRSNHFACGQLHGEDLSYYENGKIKRRLWWKLGLKDGDEILYNEDGSIAKTFHWDMNKQKDETVQPLSTQELPTVAAQEPGNEGTAEKKAKDDAADPRKGEDQSLK